ncbi:hypothetical protein JAAARDRAFT_63352 [Jaapia argillacea MUCL 33604]|uniref:Transmembrane protein n=1 Tax=Jaapia argillacea MUCL 33604 TaxID=933084 RepID=A0A067PGI6_9AGAM|nr:hypothetical protein JAAARDRAFT_63352 [Jaapia argillacea MUCL 33604]
MPFSFTFSFSVPEIPNPFSILSHQPEPRNYNAPIESSARSTATRATVGPRPRRLPSPVSSTPAAPLSRKRGWVPALAEPSQAATVAISNGYLDTPAKYRAYMSRPEEVEVEEMVAELPASKRRRTLAGSIVSTALSAALIGTAVGLTVYRLWRERGKESEQSPPPPYQEGGWVPVQLPKVTPATPRSKRFRHPASVGRRSVRHRRTPTRTQILPGSSPAFQPQPHFDFAQPNEPEPEGEDQMDWIGDKISQLIEEGKRALGKEVVVMSDAAEDEVDDGRGGWEEEDESFETVAGPSRSRSGSIKRTRHRAHSALPPPAYFAGSSTALPLPESPKHTRAWSVESEPQSHSFKEDESVYQSPELRESMEKAREMYRSRR